MGVPVGGGVVPAASAAPAAPPPGPACRPLQAAAGFVPRGPFAAPCGRPGRQHLLPDGPGPRPRLLEGAGQMVPSIIYLIPYPIYYLIHCMYLSSYHTLPYAFVHQVLVPPDQHEAELALLELLAGRVGRGGGDLCGQRRCPLLPGQLQR